MWNESTELDLGTGSSSADSLDSCLAWNTGGDHRVSNWSDRRWVLFGVAFGIAIYIEMRLIIVAIQNTFWMMT